MTYYKINYDFSKLPFESVDFPDDHRAWLDVCYNVLGCSCIETVSTVIPGVVLVIDENGKFFDGSKNRINVFASRLYGSFYDFIVGDAILARVDGENLVPLTFDDVDRLRRYFPHGGL